MAGTCCHCGEDFKKTQKAYSRRSLESLVPGTDVLVRDALVALGTEPISPDANTRRGHGLFLCISCWGKAGTAYRAQDKFWKRASLSSSIVKKRKEIPKPDEPAVPNHACTSASLTVPVDTCSNTKKRYNQMSVVAKMLEHRQYKRAVNRMYSISPATRNHFMTLISKVIRKEVKDLTKKKDFPLNKDIRLENLASFSWNKTLEETKTVAPMLYNILVSSVTTPYTEESLIRKSTANMNLKPKVGFALANLLHANSPRKSRLLQSAISIQLWKGKLNQTFITQLSKLGICKGYKGTLDAVDAITSGYDMETNEVIEESPAVAQATLDLTHDYFRRIIGEEPSDEETSTDDELSIESGGDSEHSELETEEEDLNGEDTDPVMNISSDEDIDKDC